MPNFHGKIRISLLCLVLLLLVGLLVGSFLLARSALNKTDEQTKETGNTEPEALGHIPGTENTVPTFPEAITEETLNLISDATTQPQQTSVEDQPTILTMLLNQNGTTYEDLAQQGCSQLVCVIANGTSATIRFFSCNDGAWREHTQLSCKGYVGRSGVYTEKREGDGSTPSGLYGIGNAFYIDDAPETALSAFQITTDTYWVDDPDSEFYNQRVETVENKDWDSAEHMIEYSGYQYGFVVEYNLMAEYNAGSAIFFHTGNNPTAGCIATQTEMVKAYLAELDITRKPCILILQESGLLNEAD